MWNVYTSLYLLDIDNHISTGILKKAVDWCGHYFLLLESCITRYYQKSWKRPSFGPKMRFFKFREKSMLGNLIFSVKLQQHKGLKSSQINFRENSCAEVFVQKGGQNIIFKLQSITDRCIEFFLFLAWSYSSIKAEN